MGEGTRRERLREQASLWAYCVAYAVLGGVLVVFGSRVGVGFERPFEIHWVFFAGAFVAAERFTVDLEVRREAHTLTFTEAVTAFGLVFASPQGFVIARVVASMAALAFFRRPAPAKFVFNSAQFAVDAGTAVLLFHAIIGDRSPVDSEGWAAAFIAIGVAHLVGVAAVYIVMKLAGAPVAIRSQAFVASISLTAALSGTAVSLGAASVLWRDGDSWILLLLMGVALGYFFVSYVRIRDRHQDLTTLHGFTESLMAHRDVESPGSAAARGIAELLKTPRAVILFPRSDALVRIEHREDLDEVRVDTVSVPVEWSEIFGRRGGSPEAKLELAGVTIEHSAFLATPLPLPGGRVGMVLVDGRLSLARAFDEGDLQLLETAAGHAATAIHNAHLVEELRDEAAFRAHQATHDDVTDLPSSRGLAEALQHHLNFGARLALLTIRIDSLREVNETLGRAMGDELLNQVAARLQPLAEPGWCAKTASDEFTVVVRGGHVEADEMAARVIAAFEAPVQCEDVGLAITAGIGVVLAPDHGRETEILLRRASLAASRSRVEGTRVTVWAADRDPYDPQRLAIAADLRDAIPAGELQVHFQPQVDITSGLVTGAEALVRWRHPRLGELRPDQFIAAAEYTGAIDALTEHVLSVAAQTCADWRAQGWDLDVSVNLSARNLANVLFADLVQQILDETGLDPAALTLELTESSIMTEAERAMTTLEEIHALGVSISIDDFGTGYSSLAHLRKLPVSEIKIDKSFVFDLTTSQSDEAIVRSMVDLGHHLGLTVVVEGVETVEVRRRLADMGADRIQGYLLSRPMPVPAFEQWIADRPVRMADLSTDEAERGADQRIEDRDR